MSKNYFSFPKEYLGQFNIKHQFNVVENGTCYPMCLKVHSESKKLIVFLPGAFNRETQCEVKFQRSSYFDDLNHNCISFFDPTLFLHETIGIGWFQGEFSKDYVETISKFLNEIISDLCIDTRDIIFFSTSAGGIPALRLAASYPDSIVYAGNIQTNFLKYYKGAKDKIIKYSYNSVDETEILLNKKSNIMKLDSKFKLIYTQNISDKFHYENHFLPYFELRGEKILMDSEFYTYVDEVRGHSPLGKNVELMILKSLSANRNLTEVLEMIGMIKL